MASAARIRQGRQWSVSGQAESRFLLQRSRISRRAWSLNTEPDDLHREHVLSGVSDDIPHQAVNLGLAKPRVKAES
jgi:hypothetical protein